MPNMKTINLLRLSKSQGGLIYHIYKINSMKMRVCLLSVSVIIGVIGLFLSAGMEKTSFAKGYRIGDRAPEIRLSGNNWTIRFTDLPEQYTLVNFWAAYDADSRVRNIQLSNKVNEMDTARIKMYSISLDEQFSIYSETLKADNLEDTNHFFDSLGAKSSLYKQYNLKKGLKNPWLFKNKLLPVVFRQSPKKTAFKKILLPPNQ